ncbi:uncharacterized protein CDAR_612751 [Caerostris darwini]|uniref:Uncharacterized protein n=1 Tax=Caerostris darwini TaxID=1538125 RepID=A0AAV4WNZ5_9ARAC|nr:uncharacterized protein CDAR_612751 [Caerostris darwini]
MLDSLYCIVGRRCRQFFFFFYLTLLSLCNDPLRSFVSCEFNFGYETEDYQIALINLTYVDPATGLIVQESLEMGKLLPGRTEEVAGVVVHVTSNNHTSHEACERLDTNSVPREPYIALIKYGSCRDQVKLRHVADGNASAAVLYSDHHSTRFIKVERRGMYLWIIVFQQVKRVFIKRVEVLLF